MISDRKMTEWKHVTRKKKVFHKVKESKDGKFSNLVQTESRSVLNSVKLYFTSVNYTQEQLAELM